MRTSTLLWQCLLIGSLSLGCAGNQQERHVYEQTNLLSDRPNVAEHVDPDLKNPWGIAYGPNTVFWIANTGSDTSLAVNARGIGVLKVETQAAPTGIVYNPSEGFEIHAGDASGPSTFIYATEEGQILGWSQQVDPERTVVAVDESDDGASYKGLALARSGSRVLIYAADFRQGEIDVFDESFAHATGLAADAFQDPGIPGDYAPFGISAVAGRLYVTYAQQDAAGEDEVAGPGRGYISEFEANGRLVRRFASRGELDAPWAVVKAPADFGVFSDAILVGNFGDGRILAFDDDGTMLGMLEDRRGEPLMIEGLWGLVFGNDRLAGRSNVLYFTAGIDDEQHGLHGRVTVHR